MDSTDYPIIVVNIAREEKDSLAYWRGMNLYSTLIMHFQTWLRWEYHLYINHTYLNSPAEWQRTHCHVYNNGAWERSWYFSNICFLQAQARKIQRWWCERPTEVAMPCAEDVE